MALTGPEPGWRIGTAKAGCTVFKYKVVKFGNSLRYRLLARFRLIAPLDVKCTVFRASISDSASIKHGNLKGIRLATTSVSTPALEASAPLHHCLVKAPALTVPSSESALLRPFSGEEASFPASSRHPLFLHPSAMKYETRAFRQVAENRTTISS